MLTYHYPTAYESGESSLIDPAMMAEPPPAGGYSGMLSRYALPNNPRDVAAFARLGALGLSLDVPNYAMALMTYRLIGATIQQYAEYTGRPTNEAEALREIFFAVAKRTLDEALEMCNPATRH